MNRTIPAKSYGSVRRIFLFFHNFSGVNIMSKYCPLVTCRLTDRAGNVIHPYEPGAVVFTALPSLDNKKSRRDLSVSIEGYVSVYSREERISPPIPFCIIQSVCITVPQEGFFTFQLQKFHCWAISCGCKEEMELERIKLLIDMETTVFAKKAGTILVPQVDSHLKVIDRVCIFANLICDSVRFCSGCCIIYRNAELRAELSQYNAVSDGIKRTYRNSDELREYGCRGIPAPEEVSYYDVFVNGVLQPRVSYILEKGELTFTTQDVPSKGQLVIILFTTWKNIDGEIMNTADCHYNAVSDGVKKIYTDQDELKEYGIHGIPSPCQISYFNLYVNGVLQPAENYRVRKGLLELTTVDAPTKGALVILESIAIKNSEGQLFRVKPGSYNASSDGGKIYTCRNENATFGTNGIPDPDSVFFQNLFVNAVLQPKVNYMVQKGCLVLETQDSPTVGAPVTLQSVGNCGCVPPCCETQMSGTALAKWEKEYSHSEDSRTPASQNESGP